MIALVVFMHFVLNPEMTWLGRNLDFAPQQTATYNRLWALQGLYSSIEILKLILGCVIAGYLFVFKAKLRPNRTLEQRDPQLSPTEK
jgi:hypothetical protein